MIGTAGEGVPIMVSSSGAQTETPLLQYFTSPHAAAKHPSHQYKSPTNQKAKAIFNNLSLPRVLSSSDLQSPINLNQQKSALKKQYSKSHINNRQRRVLMNDKNDTEISRTVQFVDAIQPVGDQSYQISTSNLAE